VDDVSRIDAVGQAELVRSGAITPVELVESAIERIEAGNGDLNAIVTPLYEKARAEAAVTDPTRPLAGVPYVLKDHLTASAGDPMSEGMAFLRAHRYAPEHDSYYVAKMRRAGMVLVGKSNLPELALRPTTEPAAWGPCRNPWDPSLSAGGSSGGSAAAVAAGLVPVAHATDAGGSIRIPSSFNGTVGLKPSRGRVSHGPEIGDPWLNGSWYLGAITSTVRDAAAVLDAISGYMPGDPFTAPPPPRPFLAEVTDPPGRLRIGFLRRSCAGYPDLHPEVLAGVDATVGLLADLGHDIVEAHPPALDRQKHAVDAFMAVVSSGVSWLLDRWSAVTGTRIRESDVEPTTWAMAQLAGDVTARQFIASVEATTRFARDLAAWWVDYDLLLTSTTAVPAFPLGALDHPDPLVSLTRSALVTGGFTMPFNISGQPAISLPLHRTGAGLPVGMQLVAGYGREDTLIRIASVLEQARPWSGWVPPLHSTVRGRSTHSCGG
jgi:amidase